MSYDLDPHPLADKFPEMPEEEFSKLKEDIKEHGLREKIVLHEGMILDGRHRERALRELGVEWKENSREFNPEEEGDPLEFIISLNLRRRHLTVGQLASVGSTLAKLLEKRTPKAPRGRPPEPPQVLHPTDVWVDGPKAGRSALGAKKNSSLIKDELPKTIKEIRLVAAQKVGTNVEAIQKFDAIEKKNSELAEEVRQGKKTLHQASTELRPKPSWTVKQIKASTEELAGLIGEIAEETGEDLSSALIDVDGVMVAIATSTAGREKLIALRWPEPLEDQ